VAPPVAHEAELLLPHHVVFKEVAVGQERTQGNGQKNKSREAQVPGKIKDWLFEDGLLLRVGTPTISGYQIVVTEIKVVPQLIALRHIVKFYNIFFLNFLEM